MRIAVFGATGKTGLQVVDQCLARGLDVTAFVRSPEKLGDRKVSIIKGTLSSSDAIAEAVMGSDAVISALGSGHNTLNEFARTAIPILERSGPRRIVSLVGAGVAMPGDPTSFGRNVMLGLMRLVARSVLEDASEHARLLADSTLDWTLVRPPRLTQEPRAGKVIHAPALTMGPADSITRADLAVFMVELAISNQYVRQAPMVANGRS